MAAIFDKIFVQPASGDAGLAIGVAINCSLEVSPKKQLNFDTNCYLSSRYSNKSIKKSINDIMESTSVAESFRDNEIKVKRDIKTDRFLNEDKKIVLEMLRQEMLEAADNLDFEKAANLRDEIKKLDKEIIISN